MPQVDLNNIPFVQARWFTPTTGRNRRKIVIHSMEARERPDTAENVARYFAGLPAERKASAHYCVDNNSVVQCVQTKDVAYAAPGANNDGIHIELAGFASQSRQEWEDAFSLEMLTLAARLCGSVLLAKLPIPVEFLTAAEMKANPAASGFTTHAEVTKAFRRSTHTDPGSGFPMERFLSMVRAAKEGNL